MKRRTNEIGALAGFEKSGHFFFNKPFGRGYDDGLVSAIAICEMLDRASGKVDGGPEERAAEDLVVADDVAALRRRDQIRRRRRRGEAFRGAAEERARRSRARTIRDLVTVNGVRVTVEDGSWGLVRASSNKPELVVVVESPVCEAAHARHVRGDGCGAAHPSGSRRVQSEDLSARRSPHAQHRLLARRGDPVRRGLSTEARRLWNTGSPAQARCDGGRCRVLTLTPRAASRGSCRPRTSAGRIATTGRWRRPAGFDVARPASSEACG